MYSQVRSTTRLHCSGVMTYSPSRNMIYMIEINNEYINELYTIFGENCNIINDNFFNYNNMKFDIIIQNPPFNINNNIKVPTNKIKEKITDGRTIWREFIIHSLNNLKNKGWMCFISPSIWMKRDYSIHNIMF